VATVYQDFEPGAAVTKSSAFAVLVRNAGTNYPVAALKFDAATEWDAFWRFRAVNYGSGNLTVAVDWYADTATSGDVVWAAQIAAITLGSDTQDVETKAFATVNTATDTHLGTTGQRLHRAVITVSNLDSLAAGDAVWLRVARQAASGSDTMTGFAFLIGVNVSYSDT
jgi:hypothetical protein